MGDDTYDYRSWISQLSADPSKSWELSAPVSWSVLNAFSDDLDGRVVASSRRSGSTLWSEDTGHSRVYHLSGTASQLLPTLALLQADLNQENVNTFNAWGTPGYLASLHSELMGECRRRGLEAPEVVPYGGSRWRQNVVITVRGPLGKVVDLLGDLNNALARSQDRAPTPVARPARPPISRPEVDRGLSA